MLGSIGLPEMLILLVIVVLVFGVNKIPKLGKGLGEGIKNFKDSLRSGQEGSEEKSDEEKS